MTTIPAPTTPATDFKQVSVTQELPENFIQVSVNNVRQERVWTVDRKVITNIPAISIRERNESMSTRFFVPEQVDTLMCVGNREFSLGPQSDEVIVETLEQLVKAFVANPNAITDFVSDKPIYTAPAFQGVR